MVSPIAMPAGLALTLRVIDWVMIMPFYWLPKPVTPESRG